GGPPAAPGETASVLDAAATALERLGALPAGGAPGARAGAGSLLSSRGAALHPRGIVVDVRSRGGLGLCFGGLPALGRGALGLSLLQPAADPLGQQDLSAARPIARTFAESVLAAYRSGSVDEPRPRMFVPSTRALPPVVEAALRGAGLLRR